MQRIIIPLCHPSRIGLFFKDSILKIIGFLFIMISLLVASSAVNSYAYPQFDYNTASSITSLIAGSNSKSEYDSETYTFKGEKLNSEVYEGSNFVLAFYTTETARTINKFSILFSTENVFIKNGSFLIKKISYKELNIQSFKIADVQSNNEKRIEFTTVIYKILDNSKINLSNFNFMVNTLSLLMYAVFILVLNLISSYFVNPTIMRNVRIKLNIYCLFIYFFFASMALISNISWVEYIGLFLSVVYTNICFRHIIRVKAGGLQ